MEIKMFNELIVAHRGQLLLRARQMVGDDAAAEDLVQEVMLKLWTVRSTLDSHPNPMALAMVTLRHKAIDDEDAFGALSEME